MITKQSDVFSISNKYFANVAKNIGADHKDFSQQVFVKFLPTVLVVRKTFTFSQLLFQ